MKIKLAYGQNGLRVQAALQPLGVASSPQLATVLAMRAA